jgi:hypothetical protein
MISPTTTIPLSAPAPAAAPPALPSDEDSGFFHNLFEIVNPLQHIPVVSTLYRNLTGDKINTFDRVAGDTLYGGPLGFASSIADTIFEKITGKDFGDTVLAFLTGDDGNDPTSPMKIAAYSQLTPLDLSSIDIPGADAGGSNQIASAPPRRLGAADLSTPDLASLEASMQKAQIDPVVASRAVYAYQRAIGLFASGTVNPPLN